MTTAHVNIVTLISNTHLKKSRYSVSFDVANKDNSKTVIEKRAVENQNYVEDECMTGGGCSPEIELHLRDNKCFIRIIISGALKPSSPLEKGEDILTYNEAQAECRKIVHFVPTYDGSGDGTATIKFKVGDEIKHTMHIHDVPTEKTPDFSSSMTSNDSSVFNDSVSSRQSLDARSLTSTSSSTDVTTVDSEVEQGSIRENVAFCATGGGEANIKPEAKPFDTIDDAVGGLRLVDGGGPTVVPVPPETPYDKILCDGSLNAIIASLTPQYASQLLIQLGVTSNITTQSERNHPHDVVSANFSSLKHWRSKKTSREECVDTSNQQLYDDMIKVLEDIGRKDIVYIVKRKLAANKKLDHEDFKKL